MLLGLIAVYVAIRLFVTPRVYGGSGNVHPAIVLIALPIGLAVGGVMGVVLAVPTVAVLAAVMRPVLEVLGGPDSTDATARPGVPVWLDRVAQWSWRGLVAIALIALVVGAAATVPLVIGPIVVGITLAATVKPGVAALQRRGIGLRESAAVVAVILWASIVVVTVLSAAALVNDTGAVTGTSTAIRTIDRSDPCSARSSRHTSAVSSRRSSRW